MIARGALCDLGFARFCLPVDFSSVVVEMIQLVTRQSRSRLLAKRRLRAKRVFDWVLCGLSLPLVLPVIAVCAVAIRLESSGPIFFCQMRTGQGGRRFRMFKFRTMKKNATELKKQLEHLNELTLPDFKISNDPRITLVGKFLRKTSLDELPQILNVLMGTMSLVGPRPTSFTAETYTLQQTERLEVIPGITGLWQISGRSDIDFDDRVRLDAEYIRQQSFWLDIKIIFRTFMAVMRQKGAY